MTSDPIHAALPPGAGPGASAPGGRKRRRWPLFVGGVLVLLVALVLLAPVLAAPIVRGKVQAAVAESLNATASLGSLSIGLGGHVSVRDVALTDAAGQPVATLSDLEVQADVPAALRGRYRADVAVHGLVLHVRQMPDGRLNLATLPREAPGGAPDRGTTRARTASSARAADGTGAADGRADGAGAASESPAPLPDVGAHVLVDGATLIVHAPDGRQTQLQDLRLELDLVDLAQPASFALAARCAGPGGGAGSLRADGSVTLAHGGRIDPAQVAATLDYALETLLLAALQPALDTLSPGAVRDLRGTLAGSGHWTVEGAARVNGRTELRVEALHLQGGAADAPALDLPSVRLAAVASVDGEGTGSQQVELGAGDLLALRWDGTTSRLATPDGTLTGAWSIDSRLGGLVALLRGPLGLPPGLDIGATLALRGTLQAGLAQSSLATCALTSDLAITELGVRDASGAPLDLGGLTSLTAGLDGRMDLGLGRVELARLNLAAGPVQAAAHGSISGLPIGGAALDPAALSVADSEFLLDADLDRLSLAARPFLRAGTDFGGRLHVTSTASTAGRRVDAVSSVELTGLRLRLPASSADGAEAAAGAGTGALAGASGAGGHPAGAAGAASSAARELGPLDLTFSPSGHLDLAPGGALEITSLSLRSAFVELDGDGAFTDALDGQRRAGSLTTRLRVVPGAASAACAGFLDGLVAAGEDVTVQSVLRIEGARSGLVTQVRAPALALHGGALGDQPLSLADLALDADVALDGATQVVQIASLKVAAGPASAAGRELPGLQLTLRGAWDGARGTLDVPELSLVSAIANGGGRLHADHVAQPGEGLAVQADVHFSGDAEPARALLAAFVPELAPARAAGGWELSLVADGSGTATHARPRLALHGVSLEGYVANGQALPLKDVDLALDAELTADTSGTGRITLGKLTLQAPGMTATADGHAAGYAASTGAASTASTGASGTSGTSGAASSADAAGLASARNPIPAELDAGVQATFTLEPHELSDRLAAFLGGVTLGGETLSGQLHAEALHGVLVTQGRLSSHELQVGLPADAAAGTPARQLVQRGLQLDLDATLDLTPGADRVTLRSARLASSTAQASVTGTLGGVLEPATASADVTVSVRSELTALFADLGPLLPLPGWSGSGALALDGTLRGDAGRLALKSTTTIDRLALSIPRAAGAAAAAPGGDALAVGDALLIDDPHVALDVEASVATGPMDVELGAARIGSTFLSGTLGGRLLALSSAVPRAENLRGDFTWVPGRVGALLGPLLPGELSGEERQPLRFVLDGPLPSGDLPALLAGASAGATIGLGTLALPGVVASGTTTTELQAGRAHVTGQLALNGGSAALDARLDLRPQGSAAAPLDTTLDLRFERVQVSQEMAALLAHVHPLLEAGEGQSLGVLSGAIGGSLLLDWPAPLPLPPAASASGAPAAGASVLDTLPLEALSGTAMLDFGTLTVASSPLLGQMLDHLGLAGTQSFTLAPVKLVVRDGRVGYAEPWAWTIQNIPTAFSGSVGLDQSLDLSWSVPITEALAGKHGFLKNLKGQSLVIPLRGTVAAPDLQWTAALENLAQQALASGLQEKIGEKLGPLGGLLGGGKKASGDKAGGDAAGSGAQPGAGGDAAPPSGLPGPVASPAVTPESLLAQADALWDKGSKAEAKVLYKQLKSDFKLTLTYQLNKKRVDERGKWKPGG